MSSHDRRAAGRRRAWGRRPIILKLEPLERREMLTASASAAAASPTLPDLVNSALITSTSVLDWGGSLEVEGRVKNQGGSTTTAPFQIEIYVDSIRGINKYAVPIGMVTIPAGLAPGQSEPYDTSVTLPTSPIPNVGSSGGTLYVNAAVNPTHALAESNYHNNEDLGPPYDSVAELIQTPTPANLVGTTLAVSPTDASWGNSITVTAQVTNQSSGASPQTRALLSITPQGLTYGGSTTFGIGSIAVPPLAAYQTVNLVQTFTLPAVAPASIAAYTNFGLTMTQDADYLTNDQYPHQSDQGIGLDQAALTITTNPASTAVAGPLPDLAASSVALSKTTAQWGSTIQVSTNVQNLGAGGAPPSSVFFVLTGQSGSLTDAIFLGETTLPALASGASQPINQTLQLPITLPAGVQLNSVGYVRVEVLTNPENDFNESVYSNGAALSQPFIVRLPGNATTVPTSQVPGALPSIAQLAEKSQNAAKSARAAAQAARLQAKLAAKEASRPPRKLHRRAGKGGLNIAKASLSVGTEITKLPTQVFDALKRSL
jgi:CARDB